MQHSVTAHRGPAVSLHLGLIDAGEGGGWKTSGTFKKVEGNGWRRLLGDLGGMLLRKVSFLSGGNCEGWWVIVPVIMKVA